MKSLIPIKVNITKLLLLLVTNVTELRLSRTVMYSVNILIRLVKLVAKYMLVNH